MHHQLPLTCLRRQLVAANGQDEARNDPYNKRPLESQAKNEGHDGKGDQAQPREGIRQSIHRARSKDHAHSVPCGTSPIERPQLPRTARLCRRAEDQPLLTGLADPALRRRRRTSRTVMAAASRPRPTATRANPGQTFAGPLRVTITRVVPAVATAAAVGGNHPVRGARSIDNHTTNPMVAPQRASQGATTTERNTPFTTDVPKPPTASQSLGPWRIADTGMETISRTVYPPRYPTTTRSAHHHKSLSDGAFASTPSMTLLFLRCCTSSHSTQWLGPYPSAIWPGSCRSADAAIRSVGSDGVVHIAAKGSRMGGNRPQ